MASPPAVVAVAQRGAVVAVVVEVVVLVVVLVMVVAVVLVVVTVAVVQVGTVVAELSQSCCCEPEGRFVGEVESKLSRCRYSISEEIDRRRRLRTVSDWANRTRCRVLWKWRVCDFLSVLVYSPFFFSSDFDVGIKSKMRRA